MITVLASDSGVPPLSAYFDVAIHLTDVNDKQTDVTTEPAFILEEMAPGLYACVKIHTQINVDYYNFGIHRWRSVVKKLPIFRSTKLAPKLNIIFLNKYIYLHLK